MISSEPEALDASEQIGAPAPALVAVIARNAAFVLGAQGLLKVLGFLFSVYVVRRLGANHFGQYSAIMAYVAMFAIFTDWGMSPYMVREVAQDRASASWLLPNTVAIRLVLSVIVVIIAPLSAVLVGKESGMVLGILIASAGLIGYAFEGPLVGVLWALERFDKTSVFALIQQLVFWGLGALLVIKGAGYMGPIVASLAGVGVVAVLSGWALVRIGLGRLVLSVDRWPRLFFAALPFGVSHISHVFEGRFGTVLMSFLLTDAEVGWYSVPATLTAMMLLISQSITTAMFPSMVRSHSEDPDSLRGVVWQSFRYLLIICLPIVVGGTVLADRIVVTLYGWEFVNSAPVLRVMLWAMPSLFLLELVGRLTSALHLERQAARVNVASAAVSIALSLVLVPILGILGAAVALLGSRAFRLVQVWRLVGSDWLARARWTSLLRIALAAAVMGAFVFLVRQMPAFTKLDSKGGLLSLLAVGVFVYLVALVASGAIERRDVVLLRSMVLARMPKGSGK